MVLATPALSAAGAAYLALALVLCQVQLFAVLGYEFCFALTCAVALVAPHVGAALSRRVMPPASWGTRLVVCWLGTGLSLVPAFLAIMLNALRVKNCNFAAGAAFFALGPLASALWGATAGALVAQLWGCRAGPMGRWPRAALVAVSVAPLAVCLVRLVLEPPIHVFDPLWGVFVGSLYDESIAPDRAWLALRVQTAFRIAAAAALMAATARERRAGLVRRVGWCFVSLCLWGAGQRICALEGLNNGRTEIAAHLSVVRTRPGLVLHLPRAVSAQQADAIADDHAFRWAQLRAQMQLTPAWPLHSWVFADADDKARWMGGRDTMVAKPWLHEIYLHGTQTPHPLVAHEMVHALAAAWSPTFLAVPARWGLWVNLGLVEGLAVALAPSNQLIGVAGQAAALKKLGLLVPSASLIGNGADAGPGSFWRQPPARAYAQAGALIRFLWQQFGLEAVRSLYAGGSLEHATGLSPSELELRFATYLAAHEPSPALLALSRGPLARRSVFEQTCAHEVANLRRAAQAAEPSEAEPLWRKAVADQGGAAQDVLGLAKVLRAQGRTAEAEQLERGILAAGLLAPSEQAAVQVRLALAHAQAGELEQAKKLLATVVGCPMPLAAVRMAKIMQGLLELAPQEHKSLVAYLAGELPAQQAQPILSRLCASEVSQQPDACYLLARLHMLRNAPQLAAALLASAGPHPFAPIAWEQLALQAALAQRLDDGAGYERALEAMVSRQDAPEGMQEQAADALARQRYLAAEPS